MKIDSVWDGPAVSQERIYQHIWQDKAQDGMLYKRLLIGKVNRYTTEAVEKTIISLMELLPRRNYTLTVDNGKEFASHQSVADVLRIKVHFADPYSAWQRGLNENTNGLIRQYVPKGSDVRILTDEQIENIMDRLNNRPRKSLGFLTPNEVFYERKKLTG